ncbi:MAG: hypothetical protein WAS36_03120 [Candidatus Saccharimonadales bacterium]
MFVLRSNKSGFTLHIVLVLLASAAGIVLIGLFTKNQIEIQNQEKQFLAAQIEVNALGEKIAKVTNPDKYKAAAYCSYSSAKYGKGDRSCTTKYYLLKNDISAEEAQKQITRIENNGMDSIEYEIRDARGLNFLKSLQFSSNGLSCNTTLYFKHKDNLAYDDGKLKWDIPDQSSLLVVSCSGEAKAEYFLVKDQ